MDPINEFSLDAIRWLQNNYPQLTTLMEVVSDLGRFEFYLVIVPLVYWCLHKSLGKQLAYLLAVANVLVTMVKQAFRGPRPYWLESDVALSSEPSYGIPSAHVEIATVTYFFLAAYVRRRLGWVLAIFIVGLMAFSRVFLGVHFIRDAGGGFLLGVLILFAYWAWRANFHTSFSNRILGQRLLVAVLAPIFFFLLYVGLVMLLQRAPLEVDWQSFVTTAEAVNREDMASALGILLGLGVGFILEASRVHFTVAGSVPRRVLRYLFGMLITLAIWRGLGLLLPEDPEWLGLPLRFLRYWLAGMWVAYYGPYVFIRLGLADASPEPDVQLTVRNGGFMRP